MRSKIFSILFLIIIMQFSILDAHSSSSIEVDDIAIVRNVIDGDTFDAFPIGRVRLADIDAPEINQSGYNEAKNFLEQLVSNKRVYLDVDDVYVDDGYHRLVCVVYIRFNSTHLKNVNKALLESGYAVKIDYNNEFNPNTWTLFIYKPIAELPEKTYTELLSAYSELDIEIQQLKTLLNSDPYLRIQNLEDQVNSLQVDKSNLQQQIVNLQNDKSSLISQVSSLNQQISTLNDQISTLQSQIGSLQTEKSDLQSQVSSLQVDNNQLQSQVNTVTAQNSTMTTFLFISVAVAAIFIFSTAYFATRKPKVS